MRYPDEVRLESFIDGRDGWVRLYITRKKSEGRILFRCSKLIFNFPAFQRERERDTFGYLSWSK